MKAWLVRVLAWIVALLKGETIGVTHRGEVVVVPEIPVAPLDVSTLPGVQTALPPVEHIGALTKAIEDFATATLRPGDNGGFVTVINRRADGSKHFNFGVVQRTGDKGTLVGWVGKSWDGPMPGGWEAGLGWHQRW